MATFTEQDQQRLIAQLHRDEGKRVDKNGNHVAYLDSVGILTIGYGHNCVASPVPGVSKPGDTITEEQANAIFERDLAAHIWTVRKAFPWVESLDPARQAVLYNMEFNMGLGNAKRGLLSFHNTLALIQCGDFNNAAKNMLKSEWAKVVKGRATRLAEQMKTGVWQ